MVIATKDLLASGWETCSRFEEINYTDLTSDSRKAGPGVIFFAFDGFKSLGKDFISEVLEKGSPAVFVDKKYQTELSLNLNLEKNNSPVFFSTDFKKQSGKLASVLYEQPSGNINCIAVTGTNGKTTIAWTIHQILKNLGHNPSYIGTIGIELPKTSMVAALTTPPVIELQKILYEAGKQSADYAVLETSSHGLEQGRLEGITWKLGIFTNLTEDHRDFHGNMENYYLSKRILFENLVAQKNNPAAIINMDDLYGKRLFDWIKEKKPDFNVIGLGFNGTFKIKKIYPAWNGYSADLEYNGNSYTLKSKLIGVFNIYNLSMAFSALLLSGFDANILLEKIENIPGAPGRMEVFRLKTGGMVVVDYAHTPDALKKALETLRELHPSKLSIVFGCGGDRDREKRSQMGRIAEEYSDQVVITNDNPRSENPRSIINEIEKGMKEKRHKIITDRRQAIEETSLQLKNGEVLLVAGKGHEDYQILPEGRIFFSDREIAMELTRTVPPVFETSLGKEKHE